MTVGDILDGVFKLFKANARAIVTIVAVFMIPLQIGASFAQRDTFGGAGLLDAIGDPSLLDQEATAGFGADIVTTLVSLIVIPFMAGAISQIVGASYLSEGMTAGPALRRTLRRFWPLLGGWFVSHLLSLAGFVVAGALALVLVATGVGTAAAVVAVLGFLFLGIPVMVAVSTLSVAVAPVIVVEEVGPITGVRRSWRLMRPRFWGVLGISLLAGLISSVIAAVLSTVPSIAAFIVGLEHGWVLLAAGAILASLVSSPIVAIAATLLYFDARIRNEGFDLQIIATELSGTGAAG